MKRTRAAPCCSRTHSPSESRSLFVCGSVVVVYWWPCNLIPPQNFSFVQRRMHKSILSHWRLFLWRLAAGCFLTVFLVAPLVHFPPTRALILWSSAEPDWHHLPLGNGIISLPFPRCSASLDNSPTHLGPNDCLWVAYALGEMYLKWHTKQEKKLKSVVYRNNIPVKKNFKNGMLF